MQQAEWTLLLACREKRGTRIMSGARVLKRRRVGDLHHSRAHQPRIQPQAAETLVPFLLCHGRCQLPCMLATTGSTGRPSLPLACICSCPSNSPAEEAAPLRRLKSP